ncbi:hypothetical protein O3P69_009180 [Scylla paramamosain]|uniref:Lipoprotein n=1 Tax=Scylla paramamosain TaxID=85552 RepID=A0AAW0T9C5_SCYPA
MECATGGGAGTTFANVAESRTAGESSHGASDGSAGVADVRDRDTVGIQAAGLAIDTTAGCPQQKSFTQAGPNGTEQIIYYCE